MKSIRTRLIVYILIVLTLSIKVASAKTFTSLSAIAVALRIIGSSLFGLAILWGAVKIMFSGGDPRLINEGKNIIKNAIIGYIIIMCSSLIPSALTHTGIEPLVLIPP